MGIYTIIGIVALAFLVGMLLGKRDIGGQSTVCAFLREMYSDSPKTSWSRIHATLALVWGMALVTLLLMRDANMKEIPSLAGVITLVGAIYGLGKGMDVAKGIWSKPEGDNADKTPPAA